MNRHYINERRTGNNSLLYKIRQTCLIQKVILKKILTDKMKKKIGK